MSRSSAQGHGQSQAQYTSPAESDYDTNGRKSSATTSNYDPYQRNASTSLMYNPYSRESRTTSGYDTYEPSSSASASYNSYMNNGNVRTDSRYNPHDRNPSASVLVYKREDRREDSRVSDACLTDQPTTREQRRDEWGFDGWGSSGHVPSRPNDPRVVLCERCKTWFRRGTYCRCGNFSY